MPVLNAITRELHCSIAYVGPALAGKRTNLLYVDETSVPDANCTWFSVDEPFPLVGCSFVPPTFPPIDGATLCMHLSAITGPLFEEAPHRLLLRNVDAVVFVADAQTSRMDANLEHMAKVAAYLAGRPEKVPMVLQYNKYDLPEVAMPEELDAALNPGGLPRTLAIATGGSGVIDTLKLVMKEMLLGMRDGRVERRPIELHVEPADQLQLWNLLRSDAVG